MQGTQQKVHRIVTQSADELHDTVADRLRTGQDVPGSGLEARHKVLAELVEILRIIRHTHQEIVPRSLCRSDRTGDGLARLPCSRAGDAHLLLHGVNCLHDVGIARDIVLHAGQSRCRFEQALHLLLGAAVAELQVVEHGKVALRKAGVSVLNGVERRAHFVGVVRHVTHCHVGQVCRLLHVTAEGIHHRRSGRRCSLHVVVHAHASALEGSRSVCFDRIRRITKERLHAACELLEVRIRIERLLADRTDRSRPGSRSPGKCRCHCFRRRSDSGHKPGCSRFRHAAELSEPRLEALFVNGSAEF